MNQQEPKPKIETEADRLRFGRTLFDDLKGKVDRGEDIDPPLMGALQQWTGEALIMSNQPDRERGKVWWNAYQGMDAALQDVATNGPEVQAPRPEGAAAKWAARTSLGAPPSARLRYEVPEELPSGMEGAFAIAPEARRAASILTAPLEKRDGAVLVTDEDGMPWDMTEALQELHRPEVLTQLRQSMMGLIPDPRLGGAISHTVGSMGAVAQLPIELASKVGLSENRRNVETAHPGLTLPWLPALGPGGTSFRGDEEELFKDPVWARALSETINELDLHPTGWETFGHGMAGMADFLLFNKAATGVLGAAAKGVGSVASRGTPLGLAAAKVGEAAGKARTVFPLNTHTASTITGFIGYENVTHALDPDRTIGENTWEGFKQGATYAAFGAVAKAGRGVATGLAGVGRSLIAKRAPVFTEALETFLSKVTPKGLTRLATATRFNSPGAGADAELVLRRLGRFTEPTFSRTMEKLAMAPAVKETLKSATDAYWLGVLTHSYGAAQQAPEGQGFSTFWRSIFSTQSQATGFAFALSGLLQYPAIVRPEVLRQFRTPEGQEFMRRTARAFGQPGSEKDLREIGAQFDIWRAKEPQLFEGLDFTPPAETAPKPAADAVPPDALPAYREMAADQPEQANRTVGEITPENLGILGFGQGKGGAAAFSHALAATHEYLREIEQNTETKYRKVKDIPRALWERVLDWRAKNKPARGQLTLEEQPGNDFKGEPVKRAPRQGSLEEADQTHRQVEAEPAYRGLAPAEKVAKAKATPKRPNLGRALEQVAAGKKTREWLRQTFPEAPEHVGDGPTDAWAGTWTRAVRDVWKARNKANLNRYAAERQIKQETLRALARRVGGIAHTSDLENLSRKELGDRKGRAVVNNPGEGGMPIDDFAERAFEMGHFPERPTINDVIDALHEDRQHPGNAEAAAARAYEREQATMHAQQLEKFREDLESGSAGLPEDPAERQAMLLDVYAGDPRFVGMEAPRLERAILELRSQSEAGDPGSMLAGPPENAGTMAVRAATETRRIIDQLKAMEQLDLDVTADSGEAAWALSELARGGGNLPEGVDPAVWGQLRREASAARRLTREALRMAMEGSWDAGRLSELEDMWRFIDTHDRGEPVPADVRDRLRNYLDDDGLLKTAYIDRMQQEAARTLFDHADAQAEGDTLGSFIPPFAFLGHKFTSVEEGRWGRLISWQYWLDRPDVQNLLGNHRWLRNTFHALTAILGNPVIPLFNLGPISRPQSSELRRQAERFQMTSAMHRGKEESRRLAAQWAIAALAEPWMGMRPPQADLDFFSDGMGPKGFLKDMRGPADLEAKRPGSGYLWNVYTRTRDVFEELGREMVQLGLLTQEQFGAMGGGQYLAHFYVREQLERDAEEVSQGRIPMRYQGRSMLQGDGVPEEGEVAMRVEDPAYAISRASFEEARSIRVFSTLRSLMGSLGSTALTEAQVAQLPAYDRTEYVRTGVRVEPRQNESIFAAVRRMRRAGENPDTLMMGARLQEALRVMADKPEPPKEGEEAEPIVTPKGKVPWTAEREKLLKFLLGESSAGKVYIPRSLAAELNITLSDVFGIPGENRAAKFGAFVDTIFQMRKRGLTMLRPANWTLQVLGNVERNAVLGGVPRNDWLRGIAGLPSFTRTGVNGGSLYFRWIGEGNPKEKPESWSEKEWAELEGARRFIRLAGPSTNMFVMMGPQLAQAVGSGMMNPVTTREAWMRQLEDRGAAEGWAPDEIGRVATHVEQLTSRMFRGLEGTDAKVLEWLGHNDPLGKAKSLAAVSSAWNLVDLFMFKYPAYLKARHEWPDLPVSKVLNYALHKTTNAADTSPALRRFLSMHTPWSDKLWRAAQTSDATAYVKLMGAMLFRHRFWMDTATMVPAAIRATVTRPDRVAASLAIGAGASALLMAAMDDDDKKHWEEEASSAKRALIRSPALHEADEAALRQFGLQVGSIAGVQSLPAPMQAAAQAFWKQLRMPDPFAIAMPEHGGESRVGTVSELTVAGMLANKVRGAAQMLEGASGTREGAENLVNGIDQVFGMQAQAAAGLTLGWLTGNSSMVDAAGGRGSVKEQIARGLFNVLGSAGTMYPTLGLVSADGQYVGENVFLKGQRWTEWMRGVTRLYNPESAGNLLADSGVRFAWPSRSMYQRPPLGAPNDAWTEILAQLYGSFDPSSADGRSKLRAHSWVTAQMATLFADLYDQHFDEQGDPASSGVTLDERIAGALRETVEHTRQLQPPLGPWVVEPGYEPQGKLLQSVAAIPEGERGPAIEHLRKWLARDTFQEDGMSMLLEAGRHERMTKGLFRSAFTHALQDPGGTDLVRWWWSQVKDGDQEKLGQLAPLAYDIRMPPPGSEAHKDYLRLMDLYLRNGMQWPPTPDIKRSDAVLGKEGQSRAMQGGQAFRTVIQQRPATAPTPLESLLSPR